MLIDFLACLKVLEPATLPVLFLVYSEMRLILTHEYGMTDVLKYFNCQHLNDICLFPRFQSLCFIFGHMPFILPSMDVFKKYIRQNGKKIRRNHKEEQVDKDNIILAHELVLFSVILGMR